MSLNTHRLVLMIFICNEADSLKLRLKIEHYVHVSLTFDDIVCDIKGSFYQYLTILGGLAFIHLTYTLVLQHY